MSRRPPILLLAILLAVLCPHGVVYPPAAAQDGPPTPPPPTPPEGLTVVGLPFADTFDTAEDWLPSGTWTFDSETAFDGGGWLADGGPRYTDSTLEYANALDLTGALNAQLFFRQQGTLPPAISSPLT